MGQYYVCITENERGLKKFHPPHDFREGAKLTEHCYFNKFTDTVATELLNNPSKVYWVGDYSKPNDFCNKEIYEKIFTLAHRSHDKPGEKPSKEPSIDWTKDWKLVNHTKRQYLSLNKVNNIRDAYNPLVLLTAIGSGRGLRDYHDGKCEDMIGIWAGNLLEVSEKVPEGYTEVYGRKREATDNYRTFWGWEDDNFRYFRERF